MTEKQPIPKTRSSAAMIEDQRVEHEIESKVKELVATHGGPGPHGFTKRSRCGFCYYRGITVLWPGFLEPKNHPRAWGFDLPNEGWRGSKTKREAKKAIDEWYSRMGTRNTP